MKIIFKQITDNDIVKTEYIIKAVKYSELIIAIDVIDIGWIAFTKNDYHSFEIIEEK